MSGRTCSAIWSVDLFFESAFIDRPGAWLSSPSGVEICYRVGRSHERVPMWPAGGESRFKTAIDYQSRNHGVRQRPKRRCEASHSLVESGLAIELPRHLQPPV